MKKRQRLSKKQLWFLNNVFEAGEPVTDALRNLRIRPSTLDRWLTKPLFLNKLRMHLNQYYLQARMELARSAPMAVSGLSFLSEKSLKPTELRKACNDILNLHMQLSKTTHKSNPKQQGALEDLSHVPLRHFGVLLEQFGVVLDNNGVILDKDVSTNTPKNPLLTTKNAENTKFPHKVHHS